MDNPSMIMMTDSRRPTGIESLSFEFGERLQFDVSLSRFTTARVGGVADVFLEVKSSKELMRVVKLLWESDQAFMILGGGSNILFSDKGYRGVVILNHAKKIRFDDQVEPPIVWAESGANFGALARHAAQRGLAGLEWASGIPGTVGGAVVGNAGAHGSDITDNLQMAEILHLNGQVEFWTVENMDYGYRTSILKRDAMEGEMVVSKSPWAVVLSAILKLQWSTKLAVQTKMDAYVKQRKRTQPPGASMGSMFKNPVGDYAGRLIEAAGLKGFSIGGAEISTLHANFFINNGQATALDIYSLIQAAQHIVNLKFGINLALEIQLVGDW